LLAPFGTGFRLTDFAALISGLRINLATCIPFDTNFIHVVYPQGNQNLQKKTLPVGEQPEIKGISPLKIPLFRACDRFELFGTELADFSNS
jgi:hypothetical protein